MTSIYGREQGPWRFARGRAGTARWHGLVRPVPLAESDDCRVPAACGHGALYAWAEFDDRLPPVNEFNPRCATCARLGVFRPAKTVTAAGEWLTDWLPE